MVEKAEEKVEEEVGMRIVDEGEVEIYIGKEFGMSGHRN